MVQGRASISAGRPKGRSCDMLRLISSPMCVRESACKSMKGTQLLNATYWKQELECRIGRAGDDCGAVVCVPRRGLARRSPSLTLQSLSPSLPGARWARLHANDNARARDLFLRVVSAACREFGVTKNFASTVRFYETADPAPILAARPDSPVSVTAGSRFTIHTHTVTVCIKRVVSYGLKYGPKAYG